MHYIAQKGVNPMNIQIDQKIDNLCVLMASAAQRNPEQSLWIIDNWRHEYIQDFATRHDDYLQWTVYAKES